VLTDKLDSDWKELLPVVSKLHKQESEPHVQDEYDRLVKEMIFAPRGEPTEKLKKEEDVARIEKERLEKLERERLARMRGDQDDGDKQPKHRSADDLDDGYFLEPVEFGNEDGEKVLSYAINEGNEPDHDESGDYHSAEEGNEEVEEENESEESGSEEEESDNDSLDDLKNDEESEEEAEPVIDTKVLIISTPEAKVKPAPKPEVKESALSKKITEALEKIPYTIAMPESYESLQELLENHPVKIQGIIVERIIKTNHVRLLHVNRSKMLKLFAFLLQYVNDGFSNVDSDNIGKRFKLLAELSPHMYDLIQMNPEEGSRCFLEVVKEKYEDFKKNSKKFPPLESLIFFKLLGSLFPTSDFRHPIVTPTNVFLHHILSQAKVKSRSDVASGLFLSTLVLDHQQLSKKFLPAVMNFLSGICYLGVKKSMVEKTRPLLPFKKNDSLLALECKFRGEISPKLSAEDFIDSPVDEDFKVRALNVAVHLMADFVTLYDELVGLKYFLDPFETVLNRLVDDESLPKDLKKYIKSTLAEFQRIRLDKKFVFPQPERKIQPMIRMLEPRIETVLSDRRSMFSQHTGAKAEEQKLKHMVKREFKSAKRELRRDNEFLSKIRHTRKQDMDRERVAKVKRIFNEASVQQSEYNALSRTKGRKGKF
jgi:nucleolar protein 14